ncbi:lipopolysaccharide transport periplasmic protein LptA [Marinobacteraceae bacterium S3BR75-40.1]
MTSDAPVSVKADQARLDDKEGTATYEGNVQVRQAEARLEADKVVLFRDAEGLSRIEAYGQPAHYNAPATPDMPATDAQAKTIIYSRSDNQLTFKQEAVIRQGEDMFRGDIIHYDTENRVVTASGGDKGRVEMVIQPRTGKADDGTKQNAETPSQ